ncbi:unnamed protein product [Somion occarium]|uniref:Uncharacterized protein n=1 Tax=Somion occarium TaxID=3059160 RepID=A0ABP1DUU3_9APHY
MKIHNSLDGSAGRRHPLCHGHGGDKEMSNIFVYGSGPHFRTSLCLSRCTRAYCSSVPIYMICLILHCLGTKHFDLFRIHTDYSKMPSQNGLLLSLSPCSLCLDEAFVHLTLKIHVWCAMRSDSVPSFPEVGTCHELRSEVALTKLCGGPLVFVISPRHCFQRATVGKVLNLRVNMINLWM